MAGLIRNAPSPQKPIPQAHLPGRQEDCRENLINRCKQLVSPNIDRSGMVQRFTTYVCDCLATFQRSPDSYFAPYVSLVQSSGYGKSRLLRETAKQVVTLYVCLRNPSSTGFPLRTVKAEHALFGDLDNIKNRCYYVDMLQKRLGWLCRNALLLKPRLVDSKEAVKESSVGDEGDQIINSALFPSERVPEVWDLKEDEHVDNAVDVQKSLMILALDEARELLKPVDGLGVSKFRLLRTALRLFSQHVENRKYGLTVVFVDTSSKIQNFTPNLPARRIILQENSQ